MTLRDPNIDAFHFAGGDRGVLLLHGFSGTPAEVRDLGARLHARGHGVIAPALPGHAGDDRAIEEIRADDYLSAAESALETVCRRYRAVYVVGFSMGGTLGLHLAQRKRLDALVTINAPLEMPAHVRNGVPFVARYAANALLPVNMRAFLGHPGRAAMPAHAVATFLDVLARIRAGLAEVACPLLVVQGTHDETVPAANAGTIVAAAGARARSVMIPNGPHLLTMGRWLDTIEPVIARFLADADRGLPRDERNSARLP